MGGEVKAARPWSSHDSLWYWPIPRLAWCLERMQKNYSLPWSPRLPLSTVENSACTSSWTLVAGLRAVGAWVSGGPLTPAFDMVSCPSAEVDGKCPQKVRESRKLQSRLNVGRRRESHHPEGTQSEAGISLVELGRQGGGQGDHNPSSRTLGEEPSHF